MSARQGAAEAGREAEVMACLATVTDPELDEPVTDLGFVEEVTVGTDGAVSIEFRLPTFWCAANFAYMMAEDMRDAVAALPWVTRVVPRLQEHMCADEVNRGVAEGLQFGAAFGEAGDDDSLANLRATFTRKAFQGRQEALLRALLAQGFCQGRSGGHDCRRAGRQLPASGTEGARLASAATWRCGPAPAARPGRMRPRLRHGGGGACSPKRSFDEHLRTLASVRIAMEFNGALCRGLLAARERASAPTQPEA